MISIGFSESKNKKVLKEAASFLPVTKDLGETIKKNFIDVPYQVVPNVVNTDLFFLNVIESYKFRFIHVSYMNFQKNPKGIIAAARLLKERGCNFEIFMLGNDDQQLQVMARENGLSDETIVFKEPVPHAEVAKLMQQSSAFLLFSRFENLPCVILEALCCGLPVISSRVGGIAEVISDQNGILVDNENTIQLADAMQNMINNYQLYNREKIAVDAAGKFNCNTIGKQIVNVYK